MARGSQAQGPFEAERGMRLFKKGIGPGTIGTIVRF